MAAHRKGKTCPLLNFDVESNRSSLEPEGTVIMTKPKVFVARKIPQQGLSMIQEACQVDVWLGDVHPTYEELLEQVPGIDGLVSLLTDRVDAGLMEAAGPSLKVISNHAVGVDNIDVDEATRRGIPVGNTPDILTDTTADFAFALLLAAARRVVEGDQAVRRGEWKTWGVTWLLGQDAAGATLGIIGFGRIGQAVARRAMGFGMRVLYVDPTTRPKDLPPGITATRVELPELLAESDFVSLHTPLNDATHHLMDARALAQMKPTAVLVNTARGAVVDSEALYAALSDGKIAFAAIDVTDPEPIPMNSPLLALENLIITPHIASASQETRGLMATMAAQNLLAGLKEERLPYCVNPQVYKA
jgi:lactate dehydrogenase-like 2-hydroxyacid dehydrogenase